MPVEDFLRVLLILEVFAVVAVALRGTLRPRWRKRTRNPTRGNDKRHGYSPRNSSPLLGRETY
jgi:hypothetical protein